MNGPEILARSLSRPWTVDRAGRRWQYHSRSDRHAKLAYWCILFDLFRTSALLRDRAAAGDLAVALRQTARGPQDRMSKRLGLVLGRATEAPKLPGEARCSFSQLADRLAIDLDDNERRALARLPDLRNAVVSEPRVILLAKACMTRPPSGLSRLRDEGASRAALLRSAGGAAVLACLVIGNASPTFASPLDLPRSAARAGTPVTVSRKRPTRSYALDRCARGMGFDATGLVLLACPNDGARIRVVEGRELGLESGGDLRYETMVHRIAEIYESRFGSAAKGTQ